MANKLRELVLWRHAKSDWSDSTLSNYERSLSEHGRRSANKMATWIQQQGLIPDIIFCSTAKRAQQTLRRFCSDCSIEIEYSDTLRTADLTTLLQHLATIPAKIKRVMLVGHSPALEQLIAYLTTEPMHTAEVRLFPTAAIAHLIMPSNWTALEQGDARLALIVRPQDI